MKSSKVSKRRIIIIVVLVCGVVIAGVTGMFFGRGGSDRPAPIKEITSVERLTLRLSGMRITEEYEITVEGDTATVSHYYMKYGDGTETRELQESAECPAQEVADILNTCNAGKWNGFYGAHPKGVLDGTMFRLNAIVNGGQTLNAEGSQNFPKHFHDFEDWLREKLN